MNSIATEQVTINGVVYNVLESQTAEQHRENGHHNIARSMDTHKHARALILQRPNGRLAFCATQVLSGAYTNPRSLGRW